MQLFFIILAAIFGLNLFVMLRRHSKDRRAARAASEERIKAEKNVEIIKNRLIYEQELAERQVKLQNKTFELFEQVRRNAAEQKSDTPSQNPYENEELREIPQELMRPGGFELTHRLLALANIRPGARILDIGCGTGGSVYYLAQAGFNASGADISRKLIDRGCEIYDNIDLHSADACDLPFEDSYFDAVLFECSLSLMDTVPALLEAGRILKDNGMLMLSDVFSKTGHFNGAGLTLMTLDEFCKLLNVNGFTVTHTEDKTNEFESFAAQVIMSTGSLDTLFSCDGWQEIKKARPCYNLVTARREKRCEQ